MPALGHQGLRPGLDGGGGLARGSRLRVVLGPGRDGEQQEGGSRQQAGKLAECRHVPCSQLQVSVAGQGVVTTLGLKKRHFRHGA